MKYDKILDYFYYNKYIVNNSITEYQLINDYRNSEFLPICENENDYFLKITNNYIYLCIADKLNKFDNIFNKINKLITDGGISIDNYTIFFVYMISKHIYDDKYLKYIKNKESDVFYDVVMSNSAIELNIFNYDYFCLLCKVIKKIKFSQKQYDDIVHHLDECYYVTSKFLINNFSNKISPATFVYILHGDIHDYKTIDKFIETLKNNHLCSYFTIVDFNCILVKDEQVLYLYENLFKNNLVKYINETFKEFILETSVDSEIIFNKIINLFVENSLEIEWLKSTSNRYTQDSLDLMKLYDKIKIMQREIKIKQLLVD